MGKEILSPGLVPGPKSKTSYSQNPIKRLRMEHTADQTSLPANSNSVPRSHTSPNLLNKSGTTTLVRRVPVVVTGFISSDGTRHMVNSTQGSRMQLPSSPSAALRAQVSNHLTSSTSSAMQQQQISQITAARATMSVQKYNDSAKRKVTFKESLKGLSKDHLEYTISNHKKISLKDLPLGPDHEQLSQVIRQIQHGGKPADPTSRLRNKDLTLKHVVRYNDLPRFILMLKGNINLNEQFGEEKNTALHIAAKYGHLAIVHILIQLRVRTVVLNADDLTPLMLAVKEKQNEVVHYLLKADVPSDSRGSNQMTALHIAAQVGNVESLYFLTMASTSGHVSDIDVLDDGKYTPLTWAVDKNEYSAVKYLLDRKASPFVVDSEGNVPLHWAAYSADTNIMFLLLQRAKSTINHENQNGDTPLTIAIRQDKPDSVTMLINHNCEIPPFDHPKLQDSKDTEAWRVFRSTVKIRKMQLTTNGPSGSLRVLTHDLSRKRERLAIQVINERDDEQIPDHFHYVTSNLEAGDVHVDRNVRLLQSCTCDSDSVGSCSESRTCECASISYQCWYDANGLLIPQFTKNDPPMIFECNQACQCSMECINRLAQRGISVRLEVFRTERKGWGVRTTEEIPLGGFVCEYIGEIVDDNEADSRDEDIYLFDLDNKADPSHCYCIDASRYGNVARFINHSCDPLIFPVKFFVEHQDLRFPRIAFFAGRRIEAGTELTFDYGIKFWQVKRSEFTCECGATDCKYSEENIDATMMQAEAERNTQRHLSAVVDVSSIDVNGLIEDSIGDEDDEATYQEMDENDETSTEYEEFASELV